TKADAFFENNTVLKELIKSNAKLIGLYFDGAAHDRSWIEETYSENSSVFSDLNLTLVSV
ncbi:15073_t:CDS:1, partial [Gigaspora rosea]